MKLMIIDGNSIVNRAFYGVRPLNAPDGTPTNAVYGFLTIFQRIYDEQKPDAKDNPDWSVRPNMIFAVALDYSPLTPAQQKYALEC